MSGKSNNKPVLLSDQLRGQIPQQNFSPAHAEVAIDDDDPYMQKPHNKNSSGSGSGSGVYSFQKVPKSIDLDNNTKDTKVVHGSPESFSDSHLKDFFNEVAQENKPQAHQRHKDIVPSLNLNGQTDSLKPGKF